MWKKSTKPISAAMLAALAKSKAGLQDGNPVDILIPLMIIDGADHEGTILYANPIAHRLTGYADGELNGKPLDIVVPPTKRKAHHLFRAGFMATQSTREMGKGMQIQILRKDGMVISVWIGLAPIDKNIILALIFPRYPVDSDF